MFTGILETKEKERRMPCDICHAAADKLNIRVERVFGLAYEYAESRHRRGFIVDKYLQWKSSGVLPEEVLDFSLDVIIGRVERGEVL